MANANRIKIGKMPFAKDIRDVKRYNSAVESRGTSRKNEIGGIDPRDPDYKHLTANMENRINKVQNRKHYK